MAMPKKQAPQVLEVEIENVESTLTATEAPIPVREWFGDLMELRSVTRKKPVANDQGEVTGYAEIPTWIAFCTNAVVKANGEAVMGVGIARRMAEQYPNLPAALGKSIKSLGGRNDVLRLSSLRAFTFPHQDNWREAPKMPRIVQSFHRLKAIVDTMPEITADNPIFIERPGYQPDQTKSLEWAKVAKALAAVGANDPRFCFVAPKAAAMDPDEVLEVEIEL